MKSKKIYKLKKEVKEVLFLFILLIISVFIYNNISVNNDINLKIKMLSWLYLIFGNACLIALYEIKK